MKYLSLFALLCAAIATNDEGKAFLEANAVKDGVITLASGMQYKVLREGDGDSHPTADSSCSCHYSGKLIDGTTFDSSYDRGDPTSFAPNQVIKGWTEAMQYMVEGDKWEMYIPSELGYGESGSPPKIKGGDVLVFVMEIIKINGNKVPASRCDTKDGKGCSDKEKAYIEKMTKKGKDAVVKEHGRLEGMKGAKLKPELEVWVNKRKNILSKLQDEL
jgi:FKBP-type peptidyl-prolyl cis-trans isomerase FklB